MQGHGIQIQRNTVSGCLQIIRRRVSEVQKEEESVGCRYSTEARKR